MQELIRILKMLIEMAVFAVIIYIALRFLRQTRGSGVVRGLALILMVGVVAFIILIQTLHLDRLAYLFNIVGQSVVLGSIVVFQPEIRRGIVHLGDSPIFGRFFRTDSKIVHRLLRSVARMSKERMGALIALEREASLAAMAETGITIDAELNSFLIESIFYPKSALHDGAIVVRDDRIVAASCLLPLSQNPDIDKRLGTRHRAALGLAEETDAVAVVVSEETGKVSAALGGQLHYDLTLEQLEQLLEESTRAAGAGLSRADKRRSSSWATLVSDPYRKLAAIALAAGLWVFLDKQVDDKTSFVLQLREVDESRLSQYEGVGNELLVLLPKKTVSVRRFANAATNDDLANRPVTLYLTGPKFAIENVKRGRHRFTVGPFTDIDWAHVDSREFTVDEIKHDATFDGLTVELSPPRVRVETEQVQTIELPLAIDQVDLAYRQDEGSLANRLRNDTARFSRDKVLVSGPQSMITHFPPVGHRPLRAVLAADADGRTASGAVSLAAAAGLELVGDTTLTFDLIPNYKDFFFELPVVVDDRSLPESLWGKFQPETKVLKVHLRASGELRSLLTGLDENERSKWARGYLVLLVWIPPRKDESAYDKGIELEAALQLRGSLATRLERIHYQLVETVSLHLVRQ